ncbi:MAG: alpha/beta hydrolase [Putridiphycobacter sp.]
MIVNKIINRFAFHPHNKVVLEKENLPAFSQLIQVETEDGQTLNGLYFKHETVKPLIIYFHGNTGNLYSHNRIDYTTKLFEMGYNVLMVSYRGYSFGTGIPSEKGIYLDGESILNFALKTLNYKIDDIVIVGRSLGTTVAINIALNRNFKGLILITPLSNGKDMAKTLGFKSISFLASNVFKSKKKIKEIKIKKLIIAGENDLQTPLQMAVDLFNSASEPKQLVTIKNGGHNNLQNVDPALFWGEIEKFLK